MRYRLRTLLIALGVAPPVLGAGFVAFAELNAGDAVLVAAFLIVFSCVGAGLVTANARS